MQATARAQSSANPRLRLSVPRTPRGGFFAGAPIPCGMVRLASAAGFGAWPLVPCPWLALVARIAPDPDLIPSPKAPVPSP